MHPESGLSNQIAGKPIITFLPYVTSRTNCLVSIRRPAFYQKQPLHVPEERNATAVRRISSLTANKIWLQDEQTSCTTSRLRLVLSMRERARLGLDEIHKVVGKNMPTVT